jgi:2-desacetyl-2-hydroxyethyl bacteriochlorophyllide A dehydrogenase
VLQGPGDFAIETVSVPSAADDEVLVKVAACGVCTSELDTWAGSGRTDFPVYLGHEVSGVVVGVGSDVERLAPGNRVGVWVTARGFAEYVNVRADYCRRVGDVPLDLVMTEPLACAANAVELADVRLGDDVVVVGAGFMGNLVQQLVALRGARQLIVADTRPDALGLALRLGASRVVNVLEEDLAEVVSELTEGRGADVSFECTGTQGALDTVGEVTRMSGTVVLVGFHQGGSRTLALSYWNWMAFRIVNAHFREVSTIMRGMTIAARLLESGQVSLDPLVTHRFALTDIGDAFTTARDKPPGFVKAVVVFEGAA